MSTPLHTALAAYDAETNRATLAERVKRFRAQGVRITEIREHLDANGVPRRMELLENGAIRWAYCRSDYREPERFGHGARPGPSTFSLWPADDD